MESLCNLSILAHCPGCQEFHEQPFSKDQRCPKCDRVLLAYIPEAKPELSQCLVCGTPHLYRQKDFNRKLGVGLVIVGVLLAYFTYGLSLLTVAIIDFVIYRSVGEVACCYQCESQYRGVGIDVVPPFNLSLHDYYQNLTRSITS